ncbi:hypothetical protein AB0758_22470 [Tolypothrix bouteillei VB521301_2]|uniref:hypothetical protein n=1 Tax=Tolypothrix bouteillei TaxID=1246981 RepID=UPI0010FA7EB9
MTSREDNHIIPPCQIMQQYFLLGYMPLSLFVHILLGLSFATFSQTKLGFSNNNLQKHILFQESFEPPGDGEPKDTSGAGSRKGLRYTQNEQPIQAFIMLQHICSQNLQ